MRSDRHARDSVSNESGPQYVPLRAGLQDRVEELKQVMLEDKSTKDMLKVLCLVFAGRQRRVMLLCTYADRVRFAPYR